MSWDAFQFLDFVTIFWDLGALWIYTRVSKPWFSSTDLRKKTRGPLQPPNYHS